MLNCANMTSIKNFTLKILTKGSISKYRFNNDALIGLYLAKHIREVGKIERAWIKCSCHNVEEEVKLPKIPNKNLTCII